MVIFYVEEDEWEGSRNHAVFVFVVVVDDGGDVVVRHQIHGQ